MKKMISFILFCVMIYLFIVLGTKDYKDENKDAGSKNNNVLISSNTVFEEINHSKVLSKFSSNSDSIILFCSEGNKLCESYGMMLNSVAKENKVSKIYYYDFSVDRESNNATYEKIVGKLEDYLYYDDLGKQDLRNCSFVMLRNKMVYFYDDEFSIRKPSNKTVDDTEMFNKKNSIDLIFKEYLINE